MKRTTVVGFLGSTLDASKRDASRWSKWRPTVGLCMQPDLRVDRLILLHGRQHDGLARFIADDITAVSPETSVEPRVMNFDDGIFHRAAMPRTQRQSWLKPVCPEQHLMKRSRKPHHLVSTSLIIFIFVDFSPPIRGHSHLQSETLTQRCPREGSTPRASLYLSSEQFSESACPTNRTRSPALRHAAIHYRKEHGEVQDRSTLAGR